MNRLSTLNEDKQPSGRGLDLIGASQGAFTGSSYSTRNNSSFGGSIPAQISGSLQAMGIRERNQAVPILNPYPSTGRDKSGKPYFLLQIARFGNHPISQAVQVAPQIIASTTISHILASFGGRVERMTEDLAQVVLKNEATGEILESCCDVHILRDNGIHYGDEFRCEVVRSHGVVTTRLTRLPPKSISKETILAIRSDFDNRWEF